jgi:hypothetical protein
VAVILLGAATSARAGGLETRFGAFAPRAESTLFADVDELFGATEDDFQGFTWGVEWNLVVARNLELGFHFDAYHREIDTSYRDFVRPDGSEIYQTLHVDIRPIGASVRLVPTSKRARVAPYVAGGVDLLVWSYEEFGDFIDFADPDLPIYADHFRSDGVAFGLHAAGGLRVYLSRDIALTAEGRYQWGEAEMGDDFAPNEPGLVNTIDLSGFSLTGGIRIRF